MLQRSGGNLRVSSTERTPFQSSLCFKSAPTLGYRLRDGENAAGEEDQEVMVKPLLKPNSPIVAGGKKTEAFPQLTECDDAQIEILVGLSMKLADRAARGLPL